METAGHTLQQSDTARPLPFPAEDPIALDYEARGQEGIDQPVAEAGRPAVEGQGQLEGSLQLPGPLVEPGQQGPAAHSSGTNVSEAEESAAGLHAASAVAADSAEVPGEGPLEAYGGDALRVNSGGQLQEAGTGAAGAMLAAEVGPADPATSQPEQLLGAEENQSAVDCEQHACSEERVAGTDGATPATAMPPAAAQQPVEPPRADALTVAPAALEPLPDPPPPQPPADEDPGISSSLEGLPGLRPPPLPVQQQIAQPQPQPLPPSAEQHVGMSLLQPRLLSSVQQVGNLQLEPLPLGGSQPSAVQEMGDRAPSPEQPIAAALPYAEQPMAGSLAAEAAAVVNAAAAADAVVNAAAAVAAPALDAAAATAAAVEAAAAAVQPAQLDEDPVSPMQLGAGLTVGNMQVPCPSDSGLSCVLQRGPPSPDSVTSEGLPSVAGWQGAPAVSQPAVLSTGGPPAADMLPGSVLRKQASTPLQEDLAPCNLSEWSASTLPQAAAAGQAAAVAGPRHGTASAALQQESSGTPSHASLSSLQPTVQLQGRLHTGVSLQALPSHALGQLAPADLQGVSSGLLPPGQPFSADGQPAAALQRSVSSSSSGGDAWGSSSSSSARPRTAGDATALVVHAPAALQRRPATAFPVEHLQQAAMSGLTAMRDRLKTAVERETNLRLETEMAAVDREELVHARALAEANAEVDRQARRHAEQEVERLGSTLEDERRRARREVSQLEGQLRASHAAIRALEKQVISLQAELGAEMQRREAAEVQLERHIQLHSRPGLAYAPAAGANGSQTPQRLATQGFGAAAGTPHSRSLNGGDPALPPSLQPHAGDSQSRLPYLGRLQTDATTPSRPATRTPRPFLQDVKQWLQSKQQEMAPWASPLSSSCLPRPMHTAHSQRAGQLPHASFEQQAAAGTPEPQVYQQAPPVGAARRSMLFKPQDSGVSCTTSGSDFDSPDHQHYGRRRVTRQQQPQQQQQAQQQGGWTFKPAWNDGGNTRSSPRAPNRSNTVGRESSAGTGNRMDEVLNELNDGLEQLRRSYSPPGSPYHTSTTLPAHQPSPQLPAQQLRQQFVAPPPAPQQPAQSSWGFQPAAAMLPAQPYGFDMRPVTSLLMPTLQPAASAAPPAGGAPIIQYISTYHSPSSSAAAPGADPNTRPATAAMPVMPPPLLGQPHWQQAVPFPGMAHSPQHLQYHYQLPYPPPPPPPQQQPVFEQRPYTPAVGLAPGGVMAAVPGATPGAVAQQPPPGCAVAPPSPTGVLAAGLPSRHTTGTGTVPGTARPRSSGRNKDKPLAVPPQHMEEAALAEARAQYLLDKHRIKSKRMRELQESPDFTLGCD